MTLQELQAYMAQQGYAPAYSGGNGGENDEARTLQGFARNNFNGTSQVLGLDGQPVNWSNADANGNVAQGNKGFLGSLAGSLGSSLQTLGPMAAQMAAFYGIGSGLGNLAGGSGGFFGSSGAEGGGGATSGGLDGAAGDVASGGGPFSLNPMSNLNVGTDPYGLATNFSGTGPFSVGGSALTGPFSVAANASNKTGLFSGLTDALGDNGKLIGAGLGALAGGLGGSQAGTTTSTTAPWSPATGYLLGGPGGQPGVLPEASKLYQQSQWNPQMQGALNTYQAQLNARGNQGQQGQDAAAGAQIFANKALNGGFDANVSPVGPVSTATVDPSKALGSLGAVDPTRALQNQLSGSVNNPYLDQQIAGIGSDISNNLTQNILPQLRSGAVASGQYGSSRQGIAEGLAVQSANQQLANQAANVRSGAFQQAQALQGQAANNLSGQALQTGQFNANALNNNGQFNANLGLQNNSQAMQNAQQKLNAGQAGVAALGSGLGFTQAGNTLQDTNYTSQQNAYNAPNTYGWQQLGNYQGSVLPASGLGSTQTQPYYTNPLGSTIGGALAGSQLFSGNLGFGSTSQMGPQTASQLGNSFANNFSKWKI